jgi:hypothetical protein
MIIRSTEGPGLRDGLAVVREPSIALNASSNARTRLKMQRCVLLCILTVIAKSNFASIERFVVVLR